MTAPPQPRSSLPLRVAPAFCFTRGTTNAAAAMLTTEPGGGARIRRAQCGCASLADGAPGRPGPRVPAPRPNLLPCGSFPGAQVARRAPGAGRPSAPFPLPWRPPPPRGCRLCPEAWLGQVRLSICRGQPASDTREMSS